MNRGSYASTFKMMQSYLLVTKHTRFSKQLRKVKINDAETVIEQAKEENKDEQRAKVEEYVFNSPDVQWKFAQLGVGMGTNPKFEVTSTGNNYYNLVQLIPGVKQINEYDSKMIFFKWIKIVWQVGAIQGTNPAADTPNPFRFAIYQLKQDLNGSNTDNAKYLVNEQLVSQPAASLSYNNFFKQSSFTTLFNRLYNINRPNQVSVTRRYKMTHKQLDYMQLKEKQNSETWEGQIVLLILGSLSTTPSALRGSVFVQVCFTDW